MDVIKNLCKKVLNEANVKLDAVEMVGETTRTPSIIKAIQECVDVPISRTMNSADCIARGCATLCAQLSPLFKVAKYDIIEPNYLPVDIILKTDKTTVCRVFERGLSYPAEKIIKLQTKGVPIELEIIYPELLSRSIVYKTESINENEQTVYVKIALDENMTPSITSIEKIAQNSNEEFSDGDDQHNDSTKRQRLGSEEMTDINLEVITIKQYNELRKGLLKPSKLQGGIYGMNKEKIKELITIEEKMQNDDNVIINTKEKKNALESYIYEMREKINSELKDYIDETTSNNLSNELNNTENWLFSEGQSQSLNTYEVKLWYLKKMTDAIIEKKKTFEALNDKVIVLENLINKKTKEIYNGKYFDPDTKQSIYWILNSQSDWLNKAKSTLKTSQKMNDPPLTIAEFDQHIKEVYNIVETAKENAKKLIAKRQEETSKKEEVEMDDEGSIMKDEEEIKHSNKRKKNKKKNKSKYYTEEPPNEEEENPMRDINESLFGSNQSSQRPYTARHTNPYERRRPFGYGGYTNRNEENDSDEENEIYRRRQRRPMGFSPMGGWFDNMFDPFM